MVRASKIAVRASAAVLVLLVAVAPSASASKDIPWTWNSDDLNIRAAFKAHGEHILAEDFGSAGYVDWFSESTDESRWWVPGSTGVEKDLNLSLPENQVFSMQVCQHWRAWPDDCTDKWLKGES